VRDSDPRRTQRLLVLVPAPTTPPEPPPRAQLLTLFTTPVVYLAFGRFADHRRRVDAEVESSG